MSNAMRRPPAFQCYASDLLANERYFTMTAEERGLYHSICLGCWLSDSVPGDPSKLAAFIRLDQATVSRLLPRIRSQGLVEALPSDTARLHVPELAEQMATFKARRLQQSTAGAKGGRETQTRARQARDIPHASSDRSSERSSVLSRDEMSGEDQNRVYKDRPSLSKLTDDQAAWVKEYDL